MTRANASSAVKRCGTEQADVIGRVLTAGPLTVELDGGNLRYLKVGGVEVLRALAFLVRDENWGTCVPTLDGLTVDQRADGFSVGYRAACESGGARIGYDARIEGRADGSLEFRGAATPLTDFRTARTGFVVLHPLRGVAGEPLTVEHVDGRIEASIFPALVDPLQPFLAVRALTHAVLPGLEATVRMEGDTFEMEDHRNWTDASFKTYVRPLALPWPYLLDAGDTVDQRVTLTLSGAARPAGTAAAASSDDQAVTVTLGKPTGKRLPAVGLGFPAEEIDAVTAAPGLLAQLAPRHLVCEFDPRKGHGRLELAAYRELCERSGAACELEVVVESLDRFDLELERLAALVREVGLAPAAVAVCPVGDVKSVLPGSVRPPAPELGNLYRAARRAFPGVRLGGGMFAFFTELNRKRPPAELLDFVCNTTCPIVHAADDRSVMETHEALGFQVATARSFIGAAAYRIGPSAIGCRDNPYGQSVTPNPDGRRLCLAKNDPRQRGLFGAAWTLAYVAHLADAGVEAVSLGAPTGPLGLIHRRGDAAVPFFDEAAAAGSGLVYPPYHVVAGLSRADGAARVGAASSSASEVCCLAYRAEGATWAWVANLSAREVRVRLTSAGGRGDAVGNVLDESSFNVATTDPATFQAATRAIDLDRIELGAYAVAWIRIDDDDDA